MLYYLAPLILLVTTSHFTDEETETQKSYICFFLNTWLCIKKWPAVFPHGLPFRLFSQEVKSNQLSKLFNVQNFMSIKGLYSVDQNMGIVVQGGELENILTI